MHPKQPNGQLNRLHGATRLAGEFVRDDQTTEQQAAWGDQDHRGGGQLEVIRQAER